MAERKDILWTKGGIGVTKDGGFKNYQNKQDEYLDKFNKKCKR